MFGPKDASIRGGAVSFWFKDVHPHDLATILNEEGVAIRAGHHCAQLVMRRYGVCRPPPARRSTSTTRRTRWTRSSRPRPRAVDLQLTPEREREPWRSTTSLQGSDPRPLQGPAEQARAPCAELRCHANNPVRRRDAVGALRRGRSGRGGDVPGRGVLDQPVERVDDDRIRHRVERRRRQGARRRVPRHDGGRRRARRGDVRRPRGTQGRRSNDPHQVRRARLGRVAGRPRGALGGAQAHSV